MPQIRRVFISSTCYDLIDARAELCDFIRSIGLVPVLSDIVDSDFKVTKNKGSIELCLENLIESDLVIFLLSKRYGEMLDYMEHKNISATHLEYRIAKKYKKDSLFFVRDKLIGDYAIYSKFSKSKEGNTQDIANVLSWVKDEDYKLFEFINERITDRSNNDWRTIFKNTLEIKAHLKVQLAKVIHAIRLDQLIEDGKLPMLVIEAHVSSKIPNTPNELTILTKVKNVGETAAILPFFNFYLSKDKKSVNQTGANVSQETFQLPTLGKNESNDLNFRFTIPIDLYKSGELIDFEVCLSYATIFGDQLSDKISILVTVINSSLSHRSLLNYSGKQYYHGDAFTRTVSNPVNLDS